MGWVTRPSVVGMLACLATLAIATASYDGPAAPLSTLLPAVGKQFGEEWTSSPAIAREMMLVYFDDANAEEARKNIAWAVHGQWTRDGAKWRLQRPVATERVLAEQAMNLRAIGYNDNLKGAVASANHSRYDRAAVIARIRKEIQEGGVPDLNVHTENSHFSKAILDIQKALDPKWLATLEPNTSLVLSNRPNRLQVAMPGAIAAAVKGFVAEHNAIVNEGFAIATTDHMRPKPIGENDKSFVRINFDAYGQMNVSMGFADPEGKVRFAGMKYLANYIYGTERKQPILPEAKFETPKALYDISQGKGKASLTPDLQQKLNRPDQHEPLDIVFGEAMRAYAKAARANLAVSVADDMLHFRIAEPTAEQNKFLGAFYRHESTVDGTWIRNRYLDPIKARNELARRDVLVPFLPMDAKAETIPFDLVAAAHSYGPETSLSNYVAISFLSEQRNGYSFSSGLITKLWGRMTPAERQRATAGGLDVAAASQRVRDTLNDMSSSLMTYHWFPGHQFAMEQIEPTERPESGPIAKIVFKIDQSVIAGLPQQSDFPQSSMGERLEGVTADNLAYRVVHQRASANSMRSGIRKDYTMILLSPKGEETSRQNATDDKWDRSRHYSVEEFPQAFVDAYKKKVRELRGNLVDN